MISIPKIKNFFRTQLTTIFTSKIFVIFILSFLLREYFVFNNYPFVFHPDEPTVVNSTINLRYNLNPKHFDWPTTYYYLNYPLYNLFERGVGNLNRNLAEFNYVIKDIDYYIISRTLTAVLGSINVVVICLIFKALGKNQTLSELGSVIFSLFTFHVSRSSQALIDVPMLLFASLSVYFLIKSANTDSIKYLLFACFFGGLSTSTKYNGYMIFLSIFLVVLLLRGFKLKEWLVYLYCGLVSAFGFFIGTPYALLDYKTFLKSDSPKGAVWQFQNVGKVDLLTQIKSFFTNFYNISDLVAYIPVILTIVYIIWFFYKRNFKGSENKLILVFILQFLYVMWSVSGVEVQRAQYFILIFIFLPIFVISFYESFPKFLLPFHILFLVFSLVGLLKNSVENPLAIFYRNVKFTQSLSSYNFRYNNEDAKKVLNYLGVESDKYSLKDFVVNPKDTHVLSDSGLCTDNLECRFKLISKIENRFKADKIFIYEIKR